MTRAPRRIGRVDQPDVASLRRCLSSWPDASRLCAGVAELDLLARAARAAFEHWDVGVVLLRPAGTLVSMNAAAARHLDIDLATAESLGRGQRDAAAALGLDAIAPGEPTCVERRPGRWIRVTRSSLPPSRAADGLERRAVAALFITDVDADIRRELAAVRARYGLTPAELRLAAHLARGRGTTEAAQALRISPNTVKTQLRAVFSKTGVRRQSQLAALFAGCERLHPGRHIGRWMEAAAAAGPVISARPAPRGAGARAPADPA